MSSVLQYHGVGRRKSSVARIWIRPGSGNWEVNGRSAEDYVPRPSLLQHTQEPLVATNLTGRFDVKVAVDGGGITGRAGAIRLALARALLNYDAELRKVLRDKGMLTRDPREKERKKFGLRSARKQRQFTKR